MLILSTIRTQVGRMATKNDSAFLTKVDDWVNQRYEDILKRRAWSQLRKTITVNSTADTGTLVLPKDVRIVLEIHDLVNNVVLQKVDNPLQGVRRDVSIIDTSGIPYAYWEEEDTVNAQPTASSVLAISSSNSGDTTQLVRIWGISGGEPTTEVVTLNGTTAANTANSYTRVDRVSKDLATTGRVLITSNAAAVTIATLGQREFTARYRRIRLVRRPVSSITYDITYEVWAPRLEFDQDVPLVPCHNALIIGAYAQALEEDRKFSQAQLEWQKYEAEIQGLLAKYEQQGDQLVQFYPETNPDPLDSPRLF